MRLTRTIAAHDSSPDRQFRVDAFLAGRRAVGHSGFRRYLARMEHTSDQGRVSRRRPVWLIVALATVAIAAAATLVRIGARPPVVPASVPGAVAAADTALAQLKQRYARDRDQKRYAPIIEQAQQQIARYPTHVASHNFLGFVLSEAGRGQEAYDRLATSLNLQPSQPEVHLTAGILASHLKRLSDALEHYRQAVAQDRRMPIYRVHLAMAQLELEHFSQAQRQLDAAMRLDSNLAEAYYGMAELHFKLGDPGQALAQIDKAIQRTPISKRHKQVQYLRRKAWMLRHENRWADALAVLGKLTGQEQEDTAVLDELAACLGKLGRPAEAAALYAVALAADLDNWAFAAKAAQWHLAASDPDAARLYLGTLIQLKPDAPQVVQLQTQLAELPDHY